MWATDLREMLNRNINRVGGPHDFQPAEGTMPTSRTFHKPRLVPAQQVLKAGHICAWAGCPSTFKGDMPTGWTWLLMYWSPEVALDYSKIEQWQRDGVLCPEHSLKLDAQLKYIPRAAE